MLLGYISHNFFGDILDPYLGLFVLPMILGLMGGSFISFLYYIRYYRKERKWKQQVINDWKSDKLFYYHSESVLNKFEFKEEPSPQKESVFF